MPKTSIQRRLIAAVVVSQLVLAVGLAVVALYFTRRQLREAFDSQLRGRAMTIAALVRYSEETHPKLISRMTWCRRRWRRIAPICSR